MHAFATYIEYLLMTRHYCYVPGRGAYMLAEEPATISLHSGAEEGTPQFTAPRRTVRFSQLHYHDDGLLANLLMEAEGMSYDEACRYIERQAALLPEQFLQEAALHTDIENFGFGDIKVNTWAAIEQQKALAIAGPANTPVVNTPVEKTIPAKHDTIAIPKYWIRNAAAVVLIIVCFFANFLGLNDRVTEEQMASVLDITMLQRAALVHQSWDGLDEELAFDALDENCEALLADIEQLELQETDDEESEDDLQAIQNNEVMETAAAEASQPAAGIDPKKWNESLPIRSMDSEQAMAQSSTGRLYYIIIASCPTEADAQRALGNLHKAGYDNVGVLERDGRFRLYVNFFAVKSEAESYLSKLRGIERFHDAWLLPVRDGYLSHIIKNTYNDNQLSMELSHLNQRTERDQG